MTRLPAPSIADYTGATIKPLGGGRLQFQSTGASLGVTIDHLAPGHRITVILAVSSTQLGAPVVIRSGDTARRYPASRRYDYKATVTTGPTLALEVSGLRSGIIERLDLIDETPVQLYPTPRDVLSLQALYPMPGATGLRWNQHRWDREAWTTGGDRPDALTWDRHAWDTHAWEVTETVTDYWQDITAPVTDMSITRGVQATGPALTARVGTLTIRAIDALSPRATGIHHGTPVKLIHWPTRTPIYTGIITDLTVTPHKPGGRTQYEVEFTCSDTVARLAAITRYGAKADGGDGSETWRARLERLITSAPGLEYTIDAAAVNARTCATVWETSLAKHIDALTASVVGSWSVTRTGTVAITVNRPTTPALTFTDAMDTDLSRGVWSYTSIANEWTASDSIGHVKITNHNARRDEHGAWRAEDLEVTVSDPTAADVWGGTTISIDTTLAGNVLEATARRYLTAANTEPTPSRITLIPAHKHGPDNRGALMREAARLDPITAATVEFRGDSTPVLITQVAHKITPTTWTTTLDLAPNALKGPRP